MPQGGEVGDGGEEEEGVPLYTQQEQGVGEGGQGGEAVPGHVQDTEGDQGGQGGQEGEAGAHHLDSVATFYNPAFSKTI